jgi:recombination protein RecT
MNRMEQHNELVPFEERYDKARNWLMSPEMQQRMKLALPRHVDEGRLTQLYLTEWKRIPALMECTGESLLGALMECAQLGLDIGTRGHAWILPYWNKQQRAKVATLIVGYKGMLDLAWRSDKIKSVYAHEVCEGDEFEYAFGSEQFVRHLPADPDKRGDITHAYAGVETIRGGRVLDVMSISAIEKVRERSRSGSENKGPWKTDYWSMCIKTVVRRMLKLAPCSVELSTAIEHDERGDLGLEQRFKATIDNETIPPKPDEEPAEEGIFCEKCSKKIDADNEEHRRYDDGDFGDLYRCAECGPRQETRQRC